MEGPDQTSPSAPRSRAGDAARGRRMGAINSRTDPQATRAGDQEAADAAAWVWELVLTLPMLRRAGLAVAKTTPAAEAAATGSRTNAALRALDREDDEGLAVARRLLRRGEPKPPPRMQGPDGLLSPVASAEVWANFVRRYSGE